MYGVRALDASFFQAKSKPESLRVETKNEWQSPLCLVCMKKVKEVS